MEDGVGGLIYTLSQPGCSEITSSHLGTGKRTESIEPQGYGDLEIPKTLHMYQGKWNMFIFNTTTHLNKDTNNAIEVLKVKRAGILLLLLRKGVTL